MPSSHLILCPSLLLLPLVPPSIMVTFSMSQLFAWGGQSTGISASASVLPMNTEDWSPSEWTGWISLQSKGLSRVFSNTTVQKHQFSVCYGCANYWFFQAIAHSPDRSISSSLFLLPQSVRQKSSLSVCTTKWERLVKCGSQGSLKEMCQAAGTRAVLLIWNSRFTLVRARILRVQNGHSWIPATSHLQTQILHNLPRHLSLIFLKITLW